METVEGPSTGGRSSFLVAVPVLLTDGKPRKSAGILGQEPLHHTSGILAGDHVTAAGLNNILTTQLPSLIPLLRPRYLYPCLSLRLDLFELYLISSQLIFYLWPRASENECIASFRPCAEGHCSQVMPLTCAAFTIYKGLFDQPTPR